MSFASDVKTELCRTGLSHKCCAQAEAYGVLMYCNLFSAGEIRIVTESDAFAARLPQLFKKAFKIDFDRKPEPGSTGKRVFGITDGQKLGVIRQVYGADHNTMLAHHINYAVLEESCCRIAFLRGAFLAGGSVTDPGKSYHLEIATSHYNVSKEGHALMQECGFTPKQVTRKSNYISYFKQSEAIEDFLTGIGAPLAAMEIMNTKLEKTLRGSVNRRVNCDAANLDKAVEAAQAQIEAIRALKKSGVLDTLPDKLREAAVLRLEHPEDTLVQLALLCDPPITKSALNHRLRKLTQLSRQNSAADV
ncbi:MAG: DNA-binding protein WhiA [Oscillospiraceae bacterium]|nr:DNA-binding protein WhiA [Oscillospiraceae bacterium]